MQQTIATALDHPKETFFIFKSWEYHIKPEDKARQPCVKNNIRQRQWIHFLVYCCMHVNTIAC